MENEEQERCSLLGQSRFHGWVRRTQFPSQSTKTEEVTAAKLSGMHAAAAFTFAMLAPWLRRMVGSC